MKLKVHIAAPAPLTHSYNKKTLCGRGISTCNPRPLTFIYADMTHKIKMDLSNRNICDQCALIYDNNIPLINTLAASVYTPNPCKKILI